MIVNFETFILMMVANCVARMAHDCSHDVSYRKIKVSVAGVIKKFTVKYKYYRM